MLPFDVIKVCALQIAKAIEHCHSHFVIHRDVKLENVLLLGSDAEFYSLALKGECHLKLCDFGWSLYCDPKQYPHMTVCSTEPFGTRIYLSPEVYLRRGYSAQVDAWALGMVMLEMISGCFKFQPDQNREGNVYDNFMRGNTKQLGKDPFRTVALASAS
jgi:serine/threonine protein kinase